MTRQTKRSTLAASVVLALLVIAIWWWLFRSISSGPVHAPPEWANDLRPVQLKVAVAENTLLIRRGSSVFRYHPTSRELHAITEEGWASTDGIETLCRRTGIPPLVYENGFWRAGTDLSTRIGSLRKRGTVGTFGLATPGLFELYMCTTTKKDTSEYNGCLEEYRAKYGDLPRQLSVTVSAGGLFEGFYIGVPFMTSHPETSQSQHYVQFATILDAKRIGPTIRIPFVTDLGSQPPRPGRDYLLGGCFSHDSRFLIFYGAESLVIIDVLEVLGDKP